MKKYAQVMKIECAGMSLIGVGVKRPCSWGNYFWLKDVRIGNMWWENLEHLKDELSGDVEVLVYETDDNKKFGLIIDPRIPPEYLYNKLCWTGYRFPTKEIAEDMYKLLGDPTNEFEQYIDPVSYYAKRGAKYDPKTGIVCYSLNTFEPIVGTIKG